MLSVLTLTWLKASAEGAEDLLDCTVKRSTSRLHPRSVIHQTGLVIYVAYTNADWGNTSKTSNVMEITNPSNITVNTNTDINTYYIQCIQFVSLYWIPQCC